MSAAHRSQSVTMHFDLTHAVDHENFWVKGYRSTRPLQEHTDESRARGQRDNPALAAMPDDQLARLTHYATDVVVSDDVVHHVRVHFDGDDWPLPGLALMTIHVPEQARIAARRDAESDGRPRHRARLASYGVDDLDLDGSLFADLVVTPLQVATSILFHHPELASIDKATAAIVLDTIAATGGLNDFATAIARQGPATTTGGYATITASVGKDGANYTYNPDGPWSKAGQTVYHYKLSDETTAAVGQGPLREALRTTKQDVALRNKKWAVNLGTPSRSQHDTNARPRTDLGAAAGAVASATAGYTFTINNKTPGHGLDIRNSSLTYTNGTFSIEAKNDYLRSLSAYALFRDDAGNVLTNIAGFEGSWGGVFDFPDDGKYFMSLVTAVNTILGIPMPTDPSTLSFDWPEGATEADLLWGGIGTSHWDGDVVVVGFIATGIFQYGVPVLFLAAGAAIESSAWYKKLAEDKELMMALKAIGAFLFAAKITTQGALFGVKSALASLGDAIAGILVSAGVEKLAEYVFAKIAVSEAEDSVPFVGWAVRVANMVTTAAQIAETTVEVLTSPATYTVQVKRQLQLQATVHPDPTHGTSPQTAVWPTEADHWLAVVQYKDGTNYTHTGSLPAGDNAADPVVVTFTDLPAGSKLQVTFGVYSSSDWLAGRWQGAWVDAVLPQGSTTLTVEGSIQENLVPLTAQTQYQYRQKTAWDASAEQRVWHVGDQPTAVVGDLDTNNVGNNLGGLVNVTLNDKAYMLGYCWTASGQDFPGKDCGASGQMWSFANISTLAHPEVGYKFSECGFSDQPFIVYDQFGPAPLFDLPSDVESDLDAATVTPAIEAAFAAANYPITNDEGKSVATIDVVTATAEWTVALGATTLYEVRRVTDELQVYAWPQPPYSPNNFYADPKLVDGTVNYFLRQVVLDDTTPFDVDAADRKSFGTFTIPDMNAFAVHPSGYVIAASWTDSKLQVLKLPAEPVADKDAEPALFLGGEGVRQGLMHGPTALAVTADGRILVLETINQRIQAMDINGNPVHCFDGDVVAGLSLAASTHAPTLDAGVADVALRTAFATAGVTLSDTYRITSGDTFYTLTSVAGGFDVSLGTGQRLSTAWTITDTTTKAVYDVADGTDGLPVSQGGTVLFDLPATARVTLDLGAVDTSIIATFTRAGHDLPEAADVDVTGNGFQLPATMEADLALGTVSASLRAAFASDRGITLADDASVTPSTTVEVALVGKQWIVTDTATDTSYRITPNSDDASTLGARAWNPTMALHVPETSQQTTYLDLATELKGYIYVLAHTGGQNPTQADYFLDIYSPTGVWLSRTPDGTDPDASNVNAARMIVDQWRTMFTLNYEHYQGGHGTEPSVSEWAPSTPKGTADAAPPR